MLGIRVEPKAKGAPRWGSSLAPRPRLPLQRPQGLMLHHVCDRSASISERLCSPSEREQAGLPRLSLCFLPCPVLYEYKDNSRKTNVVWYKDTTSGSRVGEEIIWAQNCHSIWPTKLIACDIDLCPIEKRPGAKLCGVWGVVTGSLGGGGVILRLPQMRPHSRK